MSVPDYQSLMLPFLKILADGQVHSLGEIKDRLAKEFKLTEEERKELLPSGRQRTFDNRVSWARTYMKKALLLENTGRAKYRITSRGREVLTMEPVMIDVQFLTQFPEFVEFINPSKKESSSSVRQGESKKIDETPEETLEIGYQELRKNLKQDILEQVMMCSPAFFEKLVVDLLVAMGYGGSRSDAGQAIGRSGDEGIDGIIKEDKLGLDTIYIQAKRWNGSVGRPEIQKFAGSLIGQGAHKGVFITTSTFTDGALDYVDRIDRKIVLIDGERLADYMVEFDIGVNEYARYVVKRIDSDYFVED
ncbi:restriction endonuclease [Kroppenstedtia eburnea]|uniref:restriction endonuclease n=1 Tax=Kroppenstedtia eburnea TaxID=714067 RepID=UPI00020C96ED|nr:mrr restriction system protein [Desmospora sp. 8437]